MTAKKDHEDDFLDALFAQAADDLPGLSSTLTSRIEADARAVQSAASIPMLAKPSLWRSLLAELGGWPSLGSLATATVAGLYIGFASPELFFVAASEEAEFDVEQEDILDGYLDGGDYFFEGT